MIVEWTHLGPALESRCSAVSGRGMVVAVLAVSGYVSIDDR